MPGGRISGRANGVCPQADRPCSRLGSPAVRRYLCAARRRVRIGIATVYRCIREAIDVLTALAPTLTEAMKTIRTDERRSFVDEWAVGSVRGHARRTARAAAGPGAPIDGTAGAV